MSSDTPGYEVASKVCRFAVRMLLLIVNAMHLQPILFLPTLFKNLLEEEGLDFAVTFGGKFADLPYFGHVLEVLLLQALEQEDADLRKRSKGHRLPEEGQNRNDKNGSSNIGLSEVIQFLDHFPQSRTAVIACARKCEAELWPVLFDIVGSPRNLFDVGPSLLSLKLQLSKNCDCTCRTVWMQMSQHWSRRPACW